MKRKEIDTNKMPWKSLKEAVHDDEQDLDHYSVDELKLFIENDPTLYHQRYLPILKNLARKMVRGVYNPEKAVLLWLYLVDDAAKKYNKNFGSPDTPWHVVFPKKERIAVAKKLARGFEENIESGELDLEELADYKPRKKKGDSMNESDDLQLKRTTPIERLMTQVGLSHREMLEDILGELDDESYKKVVRALRKKYSYA